MTVDEEDITGTVTYGETLYSRMRYDSDNAVSPSQWSEVVYFTLYGPWEQPGIHTPLFIGPHSTVNACLDTYNNSHKTTITRISDTQAVVGYGVESPTAHVGTYVSLITVSSNNTITKTTPLKIGNGHSHICVTAVDENRVLVCGRNPDPYIKVLNIINNVITSPNNDVNNDINWDYDAITISPTKVLIVGDATKLKGCILTISAMNSSTKKTTIAVGSTKQCTGDNLRYLAYGNCLTKLSDTKVLAVNRHYDSNKTYGQVLTISGNTITPGAHQELSIHNGEYSSTILLPNGKLLLWLQDYVVPLTISENTIISSTALQYYTGGTRLSVSILDTNKVSLLYRSQKDKSPHPLMTQTASIVNNNIFFTEPKNCTTWTGAAIDVITMNSHQVIGVHTSIDTTYNSPYAQLIES